MQYFNTLPKIVYNSPITNQKTAVVNLLSRASIIPSIFTDPLIYYTYDVQDGDTPETVAFKYYGDVYRYWLVLFANEYFDPEWSWPLSSQQFLPYLIKKYQAAANTTGQAVVSYTQATPYQYQKIITQYDTSTQTTTVNTYTIDLDTYNSLPAYTNNTYQLPTGSVSVTITKNAMSIYDYETNLNESKRTIQLVDTQYISKMESELQELMAK